MNKKVNDVEVIGIRTWYILPAFIASLVGVVALILPYGSVAGKSVNALGLLSAWPVLIAAVCAVLTAVIGLVNVLKANVKLTRIWIIPAAIATAFYSVLLFSSKSIIDASGIFSEAFLVKNLSFGYWIGLIAAYVALVLIMKAAKKNTGYIILVILSVIWLFPILWILLTSLRGEPGFYTDRFFPKTLTFQNYVNLFTNPSVLPFGRWWVNTMIVAVCGCLINTSIILGVSFTLSRTRFKGRTTFMKILMIIGMFPGFMSMLAVYNILKGIGLNQSLVALIVVGAASAAMGYHVCKGFLDTIPKALDEAATIDGATKWQIFTRITIPLSKPIAIYTLLTNFLGAWSDYIFPSMLFGDKQSSYTVAVGLYWMTDYRRIDTYYTQFAAGAVIVAVPIVILFVWLQRFYVEGLSGSVKG